MKAGFAQRVFVALVVVLAAGCEGGGTEPPPPPPQVRVVTFGDSNTDFGYGDNLQLEVRSYVSSRRERRLRPEDPNSGLQLAGKIERRWREAGGGEISVANHGISGTTTGGGAGGGPERHSTGTPNARTVVNGLTRFEAEVLGRGYPWHGGEDRNDEYPDAAILRIKAFQPGPSDFGYLSMGTNDPPSGLSAQQTIANLTWMVDRWIAEGLRADHLLITTLPPRGGTAGAQFPVINAAIRELAATRGIHLIDLAAHTSLDDGLTWRSPDLHVGDGLHYTGAVREWLAGQIVAYMRERLAANR